MSDIKFTGSTKAGNIAYSTISQEDANYRAKLMDDNGCVDCIDCVGCVNCIKCAYCTDCNNCKYCHSCYICINCKLCTNCNMCEECVNCTACNKCNKCNKCYNCNMCEDCIKCRQCNNCKHCTGVITWEAGLPPVTRLYIIHDIFWPVATDGIHIQIGCQRHTVEDWKNFDDVRISEMALCARRFWKKHKEQIIQLAEERRKLEEQHQHKESA